MDDEIRKYYGDMFEMFASNGWRYLIDKIAEMMESTSNIDGVKTIDELRFKQGELSMMRYIFTLESVTRDDFERLNNEADA